MLLSKAYNMRGMQALHTVYLLGVRLAIYSALRCRCKVAPILPPLER